MPTNSTDVLLQRLREERDRLHREFTVLRIGVFGSAARGEAKPSSDVDILVELAEPTLDHYMDLKFELESLPGKRVDLVLADSLKPRIKPTIERETLYA